MQKKAWLPINIISLLLVFLAFPRSASAYYTNMPATVVVGQTNFTGSDAGVSDTKLSTGHVARQLFVDPKGRLIVSDEGNNRVLIYNKIPTSNGARADIVLGQPDFVSNAANNGGISAGTLSKPAGVYSDGDKLIVADRLNQRVLIWNTFPTQNGQSADIVVGQAVMNTSAAACTATGLQHPSGVWMYNGKLIISTRQQNRVLIFDQVPTSNGAAADLVLGQPDFTSCGASEVSASRIERSLANPFVDSAGRLFVSDSGTTTNRILVWNSFPVTNNQPADIVIGQSDFYSDLVGTTASKINIRNEGPLAGGGGVYVSNNRLFFADTNNHRVLVWNSLPTANGQSADIVLGQSDFTNGSENGGGSVSSKTFFKPGSVFESNGKLLVYDGQNARILIFEDYEATATPGFTVNYPPESSGEKMRLTGNIVMGEYGKFDLRSPEVSINNQGFGPLTNFSKRQHSDHETITEFYHDFEPWAGVAPRDQWSEGDGFTAHFRATSYQSRIETQEAFLFWPFTLDSVGMEGATPEFSFHIPSQNVEHIKNNLDRFEVYIGKEGNFSKYLKRVPINLVGEDGRVIVSADSEGVQTAQATFLPEEYEVKVRAFDKWGNHFDSNAMPIVLTQALVSVESTPLFSGFWFPLQINRATGINTGIISSFRPESVSASYTTTTLTPTFTGIAFADSLISLIVANNQNPTESKTFTTTTGPDSTFGLTPTLYPDSTVTITAQKAGLSTQIMPFEIMFAGAQSGTNSE